MFTPYDNLTYDHKNFTHSLFHQRKLLLCGICFFIHSDDMAPEGLRTKV